MGTADTGLDEAGDLDDEADGSPAAPPSVVRAPPACFSSEFFSSVALASPFVGLEPANVWGEIKVRGGTAGDVDSPLLPAAWLACAMEDYIYKMCE